jgi:protocatechuate 3,4-dioxygenase beta subunit
MKIRKVAQQICALTLFAAGLFGQTVSSSLVGTVLDPAGAVIPNAPVTLTNNETGTVRSAVTDSSGNFRFLDLTPGTYSANIRAPALAFTENSIALVSWKPATWAS